MKLKNYGRGLCKCCCGDTRVLWGSPREVNGRRYCAPCWNTLGVSPTSDVPWADDNDLVTVERRIARGWKSLVRG